MKKLLCLLITLLCLQIRASIVNFWMTNYIAGGGPLTNGLKISPVGPPVVNGVYLQMGKPTWIYPDTTTGKATTNFNVGVYQIEVYGFTFQKPLYMPVPNDTATYNAADLITNGVVSASGMAASSVSQLIAGSGISLSPPSGLGNVTVSAVTAIADNSITLPKLVNATTTQRTIGRNTAGSGSWEEVTATQLLDWIGLTRGSVLYRGASGWAILTPGTSGTFVQSQGAGADPTYATPSGYAIPIVTIASANPANSTTYYFGADSLSSVQTTYASASIKIPRAGTIKGAFFKWSITTPGSNETVAHSIRVNDTADVSIQSIALNAARVDVYNSSMSQVVSKDDTFVMKIVTPAWVSAPATMRGQGWIYVE